MLRSGVVKFSVADIRGSAEPYHCRENDPALRRLDRRMSGTWIAGAWASSGHHSPIRQTADEAWCQRHRRRSQCQRTGWILHPVLHPSPVMGPSSVRHFRDIGRRNSEPGGTRRRQTVILCRHPSRTATAVSSIAGATLDAAVFDRIHLDGETTLRHAPLSGVGAGGDGVTSQLTACATAASSRSDGRFAFTYPCACLRRHVSTCWRRARWAETDITPSNR